VSGISLRLLFWTWRPGIKGTFYVYLHEIDQAVKCAPYYAKVFRVPDPVESQKVIEKSGEKSEKLLLSSLKTEKSRKPSIFSGKRLETRGFEVPNK